MTMILSTLEYTAKLLLAAIFFMPRSKRVPQYWSILLFTAIGTWIINTGIDLKVAESTIAPVWSSIIHFSSSYLLIIIVVTLTHRMQLSEYLFVTNTSFAILNVWHCLSSLILMLPLINRLSEATSFAESILTLPMIAICWYFSRDLRHRELPTRYRKIIVFLTLVILFAGFMNYEHLLNSGSAILAYFWSLAVSAVILFLQYGIKAFR